MKNNLLAKQLCFVAATILACVILLVTQITTGIKLYQLSNIDTTEDVITNVETVVVEKEVVVEVEKELNYTYDELYCMAVAIYNEAGGNACTDEHRELVGYVVLNRVKDSRYPSTIRKVLEQPCQYEGIDKNGVYFAKRGNTELELKALERAWKTAKKVLENRDNIPIPENVVFQAQFKQGTGLYKKLYNTYFCY